MRYRSRSRRGYTYHSPYSRRRRLNVKKVLFVVCIIILFIALLLGLNFKRIQLMSKGYSLEEQNIILKLEKDEIKTIINEEKLNHISDWITKSEHVELYDEYENYLNIYKTQEIETIISDINDLFLTYKNEIDSLGYNDNKIWNVLKVSISDDVQYLLKNKIRYDDVNIYMNVPGFNARHMSEYRKVYNEKQNANYAVMISEYPFIISANKTDMEYTITNPDKITNIVKAGFNLPSDYEPEDLVKPNVKCATDDTYYVRKEAAEALEQMFKDASDLGYDLVLNSAYRSYSEQKKIYDQYFSIYDEVTAAGLVAKPGSSEHQSGLGIDLTCQNVINLKENGIAAFFGDSDDGKWCAKNAHKYGFILRYPTSSNHITGISNEPWHFRYVGKEAAKVIYENNWTLEEYCLYEGVLPKLNKNQ